MKNTVAVVLAGGKGSRLEPLTRDRAKPAVPFGGSYRIIDFALSNCLNSGIRNLLMLTQYKSLSLDRHVNLGWRKCFCSDLNESIDVIPPQHRIGENWYQGTADAVYQNIYALERLNPEYVVILAGDHIYRMDYSLMVNDHIKQNAELTIGALPVSVEQAKSFGVIQIDSDRRIVGFQEKPQSPQTIPGSPGRCLASMGIYVFSARTLFERLCEDAIRPGSSHDFGKDVIPSMIDGGKVFAWSFQDSTGRDQYWRDVGTLDAYYEANMDLLARNPTFDLHEPSWQIHTYQSNSPPPQFITERPPNELSNHPFAASVFSGVATDSLIGLGSVVRGGLVRHSVVGVDVQINEGAVVTDAVLFDGVQVGKGAVIRRAIIDKNVVVPEGVSIGLDENADRQRGFTITENGITVLAKGDRIINRGNKSDINKAASIATQPATWHVRAAKKTTLNEPT